MNHYAGPQDIVIDPRPAARLRSPDRGAQRIFTQDVGYEFPRITLLGSS